MESRLIIANGALVAKGVDMPFIYRTALIVSRKQQYVNWPTAFSKATCEKHLQKDVPAAPRAFEEELGREPRVQ